MLKAEELFQNITDKKHENEIVLTIVQGKGTLPREKSGRNIHYDNASLTSYKKVEKGDFIIHLRSFEGGLEMANERGIVSPAYTILRCIKPHSSLFYESYFHTDEFINHVLAKAVEGIRDGRQISYDAFKWLSIPYCSVNEQVKISNLFDILNKRIQKQRSLVEALKKYKRGLLSYYFSPTHMVYLGNVESYNFADIAYRRTEKYDPRSGKDSLCIELEHIEQETGRILGSTSAINQNSIKNVCRKNDVLFGKLRPYLRKYALVKQKCVCSSEIWTLVPKKTVLPQFLFYLVQSEEFIKVANISSGTKMPRAEWSNVEKATFYIPSTDVQQKIILQLEGIDALIMNNDKIRSQLNNLKRGLLQQLFI